MLAHFITRLEGALFRYRLAFLVVLGGFTVFMGVLAGKLQLEAGFEKQLPQGHEYIQTFEQYRDQLFGANRLTIAVHAREGEIWNAAALTQLLKVTDAVTYLPGVDRSSVTSLWTPNVFFTEITEDGFRAEPVAGGDIVPEKLSAEVIAKMRQRAMAGAKKAPVVPNPAMMSGPIPPTRPMTGAPSAVTTRS